jgi:hypothetical protein
VNLSGVIGLLIEGFKELDKENRALRARIDTLEGATRGRQAAAAARR